MSKTKSSSGYSKKGKNKSENSENNVGKRFCTLREGVPRSFSPSVAGERLRLIRMNADKWVNGTLLHYAFFENTGQFKK